MPSDDPSLHLVQSEFATELHRLARLEPADDLGVGLEQPEQILLSVGALQAECRLARLKRSRGVDRCAKEPDARSDDVGQVGDRGLLDPLQSQFAAAARATDSERSTGTGATRRWNVT